MRFNTPFPTLGYLFLFFYFVFTASQLLFINRTINSKLSKVTLGWMWRGKFCWVLRKTQVQHLSVWDMVKICRISKYVNSVSLSPYTHARPRESKICVCVCVRYLTSLTILSYRCMWQTIIFRHTYLLVSFINNLQ